MKVIDILSFDCGTRRLGVCHMSFNVEYTKDIIEAVDNGMDVMEIIDTAIVLNYYDNIDLSPGVPIKGVNQLDLAKNLSIQLGILHTQVGDPTHILIECQPIAVNSKSAIVCGQLALHYVQHNPDNVHLVSPTLKNTISLGNNLDIATIRKRNYASSYTTNKAHARDNFRHWMKTFNYKHPPKKPINDIADAFMQAVSWVRLNY